jgi:hypothetical protein
MMHDSGFQPSLKPLTMMPAGWMYRADHVRSPSGCGMGSPVSFWEMRRTSWPSASSRVARSHVTVPKPVCAASPTNKMRLTTSPAR